MITERELIDDILKLKEKVDIYSNPFLRGFIDGHLWHEIEEKINEIISILRKYGCEIK